MPNILTDVTQLTPRYLTALLREQGVLSEETIADVKVTQSLKSNPSTAYHLSLTYAADPIGTEAPKTLFLKLSNPDFPWIDDQEVVFYEQLVPQMQKVYAEGAWPFIHCYEAAYSSESKGWHILLENLAETHGSTADLTMPDERFCRQTIDALARLHAVWWEHPWLGERVGRYLTQSDIDGFEANVHRKLAQHRPTLAPQLGESAYQTLTQATAAWPIRRRARVVAGQGVTLIHRDMHPGNLLFPRNPSRDTIKLIDWQSWRVDVGTDDVAYFLAFHWDEEPGRHMEKRLLRHYFQQLLAYGVREYTWDDCLYDYRASIIRMLSVLTNAMNPGQERVKRGLSAFTAWKCETIL